MKHPRGSAKTLKHHTHLTPESKRAAKAAAKKAGRHYPNMVDNMNAAKKQKKESRKH